ncbi:unnamed protein product [Strongylus vulgaris]|uniref:Uncharacterized protein n=1 Tax=Strongylus vulgaris TaxID=40348 RepID=A0A3P7LZZ9_STRVU|nr:unnamed protein product [Strongylus vulgaris]
MWGIVPYPSQNFYFREREFTYVLEGSTANQPTRFRVLYRGPLSTHTVTDEDIVHLRVQSINRKNVASDFSEVITLVREPELVITKPAQLPSASDFSEVITLVREPELVITKPAQLPSAVIEGYGKGAIRVTWTAPKIVIPPTATLMFELRRIDDKSEIVYSGSEPTCRIEGLTSRQHVEVQDNVDVEGSRSIAGYSLSCSLQPNYERA